MLNRRRSAAVYPLPRQTALLSTPPPSPPPPPPPALANWTSRSMSFVFGSIARRGIGRMPMSMSHMDLASLDFGGRHKSYVVSDDKEANEETSGFRIGGRVRPAHKVPGGFVQKMLPTHFPTGEEEDRRKGVINLSLVPLSLSAPPSKSRPLLFIRPVVLHVYRLKDRLGFYHTGLVFCGHEYTFCHGVGICRHTPGQVEFATRLGAVTLGHTQISEMQFHIILKDMSENGFGHGDYDVMENSCNSFTAALSRRLLGDLAMCRYPAGVRHQSRLADWLSPVARALDLVQHGDHDQDREHNKNPGGFRGSRWVVGRGSSKIGESIGVGDQASMSAMNNGNRRTSF